MSMSWSDWPNWIKDGIKGFLVVLIISILVIFVNVIKNLNQTSISGVDYFMIFIIASLFGTFYWGILGIGIGIVYGFRKDNINADMPQWLIFGVVGLKISLSVFILSNLFSFIFHSSFSMTWLDSLSFISWSYIPASFICGAILGNLLNNSSSSNFNLKNYIWFFLKIILFLFIAYLPYFILSGINLSNLAK